MRGVLFRMILAILCEAVFSAGARGTNDELVLQNEGVVVTDQQPADNGGTDYTDEEALSPSSSFQSNAAFCPLDQNEYVNQNTDSYVNDLMAILISAYGTGYGSDISAPEQQAIAPTSYDQAYTSGPAYDNTYADNAYVVPDYYYGNPVFVQEVPAYPRAYDFFWNAWRRRSFARIFGYAPYYRYPYFGFAGYGSPYYRPYFGGGPYAYSPWTGYPRFLGGQTIPGYITPFANRWAYGSSAPRYLGPRSWRYPKTGAWWMGSGYRPTAPNIYSGIAGAGSRNRYALSPNRSVTRYQWAPYRTGIPSARSGLRSYGTFRRQNNAWSREGGTAPRTVYRPNSVYRWSGRNSPTARFEQPSFPRAYRMPGSSFQPRFYSMRPLSPPVQPRIYRGPSYAPRYQSRVPAPNYRSYRSSTPSYRSYRSSTPSYHSYRSSSGPRSFSMGGMGGRSGGRRR
jgi:hypothetical protein